MEPVDDSALLRRYAENHSDEAFAALVTRYINLVYSVALRQVGNPHQAEEIAQAVFIILAKKALRLRHYRALSSWLFQTTRLTAHNFVRREARRYRREQEACMQTVLDESGGDDTWRQIAPLLDAAVAALNEKDRRAIVLRFYESRNLREIAVALGANEAAAKKRVSRALDKLQRFFSKRGVNSTTAAIAGTISANAVQVAPAMLAKTVPAVVAAKGAVVSASTAALVKGALKMMVWTKAKNSIVTGGLTLLVAGMGLVALHAVHSWRVAHYPDIQGAWEGTMLLDYSGIGVGEAARTHVVLRLTKTKEGYKATTDWIEMGRKNVPMGAVTYDYPFLRMKQNPRNIWKLRVNANATQMVLDHWIHFIQNAPVLFLRTATPEAVPARLTEKEFAPRAGSELQGYWKGKFGAGSNAVPVNLKISELPDGTFRAEGDSPMEGTYGRPITVSFHRPLIKFADAIGGGLFQGAIRGDDTEMIGSWTQNGKSFPASLKRADYRAEHARDAEKYYSFSSRNDLQGHWRGSWIVPIAKTRTAIRLALDIARLPDGSYSAALSNIDQFGNDGAITPSDFEYHFPNLRLKWEWIGCTYEGKLKDGKIVGTWFQGGGGFPLTFERTEAK